MPGGTPQSPKLAAFLPAFPSLLRQQTKGAVYPAQRAILSAAVEGASVDFDTASRIESRYLTKLIVGQNFKNMTQAFFFDLQAINAGKLRPEGHEKFVATRVGVLGAGMMGAGIAYACARCRHAGRAQGRLARGGRARQGLQREAQRQGHRARQADPGEVRRDARPHHPDRGRRRPGRVRPGDRGGLRGPEPQAPGVRRGPAARERRRAAVLQHLDPARSPSSRPVSTGPRTSSGCTSSARSTRCRWSRSSRETQTSDAALARAYDVVLQIKKTPIVVNDSRGFYTSRVIGTMVNEGLAMLAEGVPPMSLERAALQDGYPVGPLQLTDELNMELMAKIARATTDAAERDGTPYDEHPGTAVVTRMIELGRPSRLKGAGFYDYEDGRRTHLWAGLAEEFPVGERADPVRRREGPADVHRGDRDREVLRGGGHRVLGRRQHRVDHGHRLPGQLRGSRAVHDRLPGRRRARRRASGRSGSRRSSPAPTSSPTGTASGSGRRRTSATWRRRVSVSRAEAPPRTYPRPMATPDRC